MSRRRPDEVSEASAQATEALAVARRRLDQDDAEGARRFVEKALRLDPRHSEAGEFSAWLGKFGPGTKYDDAALAVLTATSHYAIFDLPKYQPVDATSAAWGRARPTHWWPLRQRRFTAASRAPKS